MGGIRALDPKIGTVSAKSAHTGSLIGTDLPGETEGSSGSSGTGSEAEERETERDRERQRETERDEDRPPLVVKPGCRLFVGLGGGATGEDQVLPLCL